MSDLHKPIKILSKGWKRIKCPDRLFADGTSITRCIPNATLLDELIRIPQSSDFDPFELHKHRKKLPRQETEYENQKLLQHYSNNLVKELIEKFSPHKNQCEVDKFLRSFCDRHNINYENYRFDFLLKSYCMSILTIKTHNREKATDIEKLRQEIYGECKTGADFMQANSEESAIIIRKLKKLEDHRQEKKRFEALRMRRFSELDISVKDVEYLLRYINLREEIQEYNQAVIADGNRNRKKRRKYTVPSLRQCLFCYRFKLSTGEVYRTCGERECINIENAIRASMKRKKDKQEELLFFDNPENPENAVDIFEKYLRL